MSDTTRPSLLLRIRDRDDAAAWREFETLYAPLLYRYARARGLSHADAEDIRATCYVQIVEQIARFEYEASKGGFKAWLHTLVRRRVIDLSRRKQRREHQVDAEMFDDSPADAETAAAIWEREWKRQHLRWCVEQVEPLVPETTYAAFKMLVEEDAEVAEVGAALGLNSNQVYKAKSRVLECVRQKMRTLYPDAE